MAHTKAAALDLVIPRLCQPVEFWFISIVWSRSATRLMFSPAQTNLIQYWAEDPRTDVILLYLREASEYQKKVRAHREANSSPPNPFRSSSKAGPVGRGRFGGRLLFRTTTGGAKLASDGCQVFWFFFGAALIFPAKGGGIPFRKKKPGPTPARKNARCSESPCTFKPVPVTGRRSPFLQTPAAREFLARDGLRSANGLELPMLTGCSFAEAEFHFCPLLPAWPIGGYDRICGDGGRISKGNSARGWADERVDFALSVIDIPQ